MRLTRQIAARLPEVSTRSSATKRERIKPHQQHDDDGASPIQDTRAGKAVLVLAAYGLLAALRDNTPAVLNAARFPADGKNRTALL